MKSRLFIFALSCTCVLPAFGAAAEYEPLSSRDILIADFEGSTYGDWKAEGAAFGNRPAVANVSPGNKVVGQWGRGLVSSYEEHLLSPTLIMERHNVTRALH
jgi:hypothetical protein